MEGGTGVYYQAMPAVGPDGKNVMKLIPVQKVNGQFYQTEFNTERDNVEGQLKVHSKPVCLSVASLSQAQTRLPSLQPIADGRYVLKTPPQVSTLFNSAKVVEYNWNSGTEESSRPPKQACVPLAKPTISQNAWQLPSQTNVQAMAVVQKLPVTVKSPVLPNGHCLQIPPNAQVRTLPASALPQSIKSRIMNSVSITPTNGKGQPTVVLVSPVNSVKLNSDQQVFSLTKPSQIQKTLLQNVPANVGTSSPVCSQVNSKTSEEVSTPIKWVVQEETGASGPFLVPVSSRQVNPVTIKAVKPVESVTSANEIFASKPWPTPTSQEKITPGKDNALVMCNGKVYFVAKKNSEIAKDVMVSEGGKKGFVCISPALPASSALGLNSPKATDKKDPKINVSEIIDLCDDDEESSTSLGGAPGNLPTRSQTEVDESNEDSNVIFVSYIPPKSETPAGEKDTNFAFRNKRDDIAPTEKGKDAKSVSQNEREEPDHAEMEVDVGQVNTAAKESDNQMYLQEQVKESEPAERNLSSLFENVDMEGEKHLESGIPPITMLGHTRCHDGAAVVETVSGQDGVLEKLHNVCVQATDNTEKNIGNPAPVQGSQQRSDSQLRKAFGITSDVRICLQKRRTERSVLQAEKLIINKRTLDGLRRVIQESQLQSKIQMMMQVPHKKTEDNEGLKEVKRKKMKQNGKDGHQESPSISTTNISPPSKRKANKLENASFFPMENSLISQTCQEEVCSSSRNTKEVAESAANTVHMQSEASTEFTGDTHCLTSSSDQIVTQTPSQTVSPSSALRKTPARSKRGKVCTACPCGTLLGVTEATSSLHPQETPPAVIEPHKATRSCMHKKRGKGCQPMGDHSSVKKAGKKRLSSSPRKKKVPSTKSTSEMSHSISSFDSLVNNTAALSSSLQESNKQIATSSNKTECCVPLSSDTQAETSEQDTSQVQIASNETSVPFYSKQQGSTVDELPTQNLYSMEVLDAEEIKRQERIKRLKDLLKEKEAALERMRRSMNV